MQRGKISHSVVCAEMPLQFGSLARFTNMYEQVSAWKSDSLPAGLGRKTIALTEMGVRDLTTGPGEKSSFHPVAHISAMLVLASGF